MSHWNIRIVELKGDEVHPEPLYEFREIYYEDDESLKGHTPVSLMGDTKEELQTTINRLQEALNNKPIIKEKEFYD